MSLSLSDDQRHGLRNSLLLSGMLTLAAMGGAGAGLYLKKPPPPLSSEELSALEPSPDHLNFGEVWEDAHFSIVLPITNQRAHDIEIKRFLKSCNCSLIEPPSITIPAGQTREVRVTLDLASRKAEELGKAVRDFEVSISPELSGEMEGEKRMWWTIRGRVRSAIQCDPPVVDFGRVSELTDPPPSQRAIIKSYVPLRDITATCTSTLFDVKVERRSAKQSDLIELVIRPHGRLPKSDIRCAVSIKTVLADGKSLPAKQLQIAGKAVGDIEASSPTVMFGACPVGKTVEETVALRSLTGRSFTATGVRCEGAGLSVKRADESTASFPTFRIKQNIGLKGEQQGKVIFDVHPDGGKDDKVVVVVSWCGTDGSNK